MVSALESMLETQRRMNKRAKKKPGNPGVALYPIGIEKQYARYLKMMVKFMRQQIRDRLYPRLGTISEVSKLNRPDSVRSDSYALDIARIIDTIKLETARRYGLASVSNVAKGVADMISSYNKRQVSGQFKRSLGVDLFLREPYLQPELDAFSFWNSRLVTEMSDNYLNQVQNVALNGLQSGESTKSMREKIQSKFGVSERRAQLIARDQVSKLNGQLTMLRQQEAGVTKYVWSTAKDERVRPEHAAREGETFSWNDPPSDGHPGQPINCRCVAQPVLEIEADPEDEE
jgi:SPP1 gp7 family putative phage head morphogenesis protein